MGTGTSDHYRPFQRTRSLIESGKILATLYQRPFTQGKLAFETLCRYLVEGVQPEPITRLAPHIILRSNLPLFLERLPDTLEMNNGTEGFSAMDFGSSRSRAK